MPGTSATNPIEWLNTDCFCITVDDAALQRELDADAATRGLYESLRQTHAYLFSHAPIFVSRDNVTAMERLVTAVETVLARPDYREAALGWAPAIARYEPGPVGALMGFDFHVTAQGPRLIEINTNAGGAFLNAALARAQIACCAPVLSLLQEPASAVRPQDALFAMFAAEWRRQRGTAVLGRVAIVDETPARQYLYPEFLLASEMFRAHGVEAVICDPHELQPDPAGLRHDGRLVDLVYNRLTDFALEQPGHAALRDAYVAGRVVVTPNPHAHALYADKRNLALLSDADRLREWGVDAATIDTLQRAVPRTAILDPARGDEFWAARRNLFFKPVAGFGGRATYRGDKLTRKVWSEILRGRYVAQELVPPSERSVRVDGQPVRLKLDLRCYVYDGRVLSVAARLYQGQTTNFRTPGGGFATVFCPAG
jgi:glutathione synthase/RimK-type ligase-like ATP-grasp enzyme